MIDLCVIICAHNPRQDYLRRVLEALRNQTLPVPQWELLLIDNNSTVPLISAWDLSWHPHARHIFEPKLGLAYARQCGMRESSAEVIVFVDDDNVLDQSYLSEVFRISREWPRLGVWGSGSTSLELEVEPPGHLKEFLSFLALREAKAPRWSNVFTCIDATPWGAGLCARASVAAAYLELWKQSMIHIPGRTGSFLLSGEDDEIGYTACSLGLGMGVFPELRLIHLIPKKRLTEEYLLQLREGQSTSRFLLNYKWQGAMPLDPFSPLGLLRALKDIVVHHRGVHRRMYLADLRASLNARKIIADNPWKL